MSHFILAQGDARSLEETLDDFKAATNPALKVSCLLIGRDSECKKLLALLQGPPCTIDISATTEEEAAAFVGACIQTLPEKEQDSFWARAICLSSSSGFRIHARSERPLILLASNQISGSAVSTAKHHQIVLRAGSSVARGHVIELGNQPIPALVDALSENGLDRNHVYELCHEANGYLERIRRRLLVVAPPTPYWGQPPINVLVAATILVGSWDESSEADREVVAKITGTKYEDFIRSITPFQNGPEPLANCAGTVWKVHSRASTWRHLEKSLTKSQFIAFLESAREVLLDNDPRFDLVPEKRWMAGVHEKRRAYSSHLRDGLVGGLLHASAIGSDDASCYAGRRAQDWIDGACHKLFKSQSEPNFWRRVRNELRELAEASPTWFLSALEQDLSAQIPQIVELFEEEGDHGACLHSDLLWALEILAWAPEHVGRVVLVLAALAIRDPGGRWSNRPSNSLMEILLPARPQCGANAQERQALLRLLIDRHPEAGWSIGKSLMPSHSVIVTPTARPLLRQWGNQAAHATILLRDYWAEVKSIAEILLESAGRNVDHWLFFLSNLRPLTPEHQESVLERVEALSKELNDEERELFREKLRKLLHHHNQFRKEDEKVEWVYPEEVLDRLEALYISLKPIDPVAQLSWLFSYHVERPMNVSVDWRQETESTKAEQSVAAETLATLDPNALLEALSKIENAGLLGYCIGQSSRGEELESDLLSLCVHSDNKSRQEFIRGFADARYKAKEGEFVNRWCVKESKTFLSARGAARVFEGLPATQGIWDLVDDVGPECFGLYWKNVGVHLVDQPKDAERATRSLLSVGRALAAIDLLAANTKGEWLNSKANVDLVVEALEAGLPESNENPALAQRVAYDIARLIKALAKSGQLDLSKLVHIEWMYFGILEYQAQHDLVIFEQLIAEPEMFMQLIALVYIPAGESKEDRPEPTDAERGVATQAWRILDGWKPFLKISTANMPPAEKLIEFIEKVREIAASRRYASIVEDHLGRALASTPIGSDGVWPHESVREILEKRSTKELRDGFFVGKRNMRGVTTRGVGDGGEQERDLAESYETEQRALAATSPRVSALLGQLADEYRAEGRQIDVETLKRG